MSKAFDVFHAGAWADLGQYCYQPSPDFGLPGKLFLGGRVGLEGAEVSLNRMPAGEGMPFFHRHRRNEELYIFVGGEGEMQIGDERFPVREGTVVRVSTSADRIWRNVSAHDLYFICVQYRVGESDREGHDGEVSARPLPW
ncbi:MAG: cupin domain-containing protein [Gemmataceae bacterium]|nr:cupin domain-containing protein [Gemmataceae bacterium]